MRDSPRLTLNKPSLLKDKCYIDGAWVGSDARIEA